MIDDCLNCQHDRTCHRFDGCSVSECTCVEFVPNPHAADPWNRRYPPGVKCEPCTARAVWGPIFHPSGRPCSAVDVRGERDAAAANVRRYTAHVASVTSDQR